MKQVRLAAFAMVASIAIVSPQAFAATAHTTAKKSDVHITTSTNVNVAKKAVNSMMKSNSITVFASYMQKKKGSRGYTSGRTHSLSWFKTELNDGFKGAQTTYRLETSPKESLVRVEIQSKTFDAIFSSVTKGGSTSFTCGGHLENASRTYSAAFEVTGHN